MNWFKKLTGKKEEGLKPGNWVNSYSKGIYRIERFADEYFDESNKHTITGDNKIGDKHPQRTVVLKRFLNSKFQKSISYETCSEYFISPLTAEQKAGLDIVLKENPSLIDALNDYTIPTIISIHNMDLQIDDKENLEKVNELLMFIKQGKTFTEIKDEMSRKDILKLVPESYGNYFFQLFNHDFEYNNKAKIWRDAKVLSRKEINEK